MCGPSELTEIPNEAIFSRFFAEFAESAFPARIHEAVVRRLVGTELTKHVFRDPTATKAREKPASKEKAL